MANIVFREPQWMSLEQYEGIVSTEQLGEIENNEKQLDRIVMPYSHIIGRYGKLSGKNLEAVIYRYSFRTNPRNVRFGFRIFLGEEVIEGGGNMSHVDEVKMTCNERAKNFVQSKVKK